MKQDSISMAVDVDKLRALKLYMGKKGIDLENELQDQLQRLYEKHVPAPVREYIKEGNEDTPLSAVLSKKAKDKNNTASLDSLQRTE